MPRSTHGDDYQDVPRPVAVLVDEYPPHFYDPPNSHKRAQLLFASAGVLSVMTEAVSFTIPPQRAVWMPAGVRHEAVTRSPVSVRTLYVDPAADPRLPDHCQVLDVSSLLRELILEAVTLPLEYDETGREGRIMRLILDEIVRSAAHEAIALQVPMPRHPRLVRMCRAFIEEPSDERDLDAWAREAGMGRRTFTRAFREETGMSFPAWRQQARLAEALSRLSLGESVTETAFDVGYSSPSAFTAMFRRTFGVAPSHYFDS